MRETAFGLYLRAKRTEAGLSLREVAVSVGVSHVFISEVERGVRSTIKRERWGQLEEAIPGFSATEAERISMQDKPLQLSLEDAPPQYQSLGLALARRIEKRDLKQGQFDELMRILSGGNEDD